MNTHNKSGAELENVLELTLKIRKAKGIAENILYTNIQENRIIFYSFSRKCGTRHTDPHWPQREMVYTF